VRYRDAPDDDRPAMTAPSRMTSRLPPALGYPDFRRFLAARFIVSLAVEMQTVAVGYQVYQVTRNPLDLGLIGLSQFLPFVVFVFPAGHLADSLDRRRIVALCYVALAVCSGLLAVFTLNGLQSAGPVLLVMVLFGTARAFLSPTNQSLLPNLVEPRHLGGAVALGSSLLQIATIVGPAIGGLLFVAGPDVVYGTVLVLVAGGAVLVSGLRTGGRGSRPRDPLSVETLLSGIRFVRSRPIVLGSISLDLFAVLFGGATALLPVYASDILAVGPAGLGLLRAAPAVGAVVSAALLATLPVTRRVGRWMLGMVAVFGLSTLVFGVSTSFLLSLAALAVLGAADQVSVYVRHLLVQLVTPDAIRGRVSAVNAVFIGASNELGEFESGVTAAWWGAVPAVVVGGVATIVIAGLWTVLFPSLRRLDRFPEADSGESLSGGARAVDPVGSQESRPATGEVPPQLPGEAGSAE
jgi:MFS family permease